jgi:outer membrane protein assembly factor BamB
MKKHIKEIRHHVKKVKDHVVRHAKQRPPHPYFVYSMVLIVFLLGFSLQNVNLDLKVTGFASDVFGTTTIENTSNPSDITEWPMFGRSLNRTGHYPGTVNITGDFILIWNFTAPAGIQSSPAISGGILYTGTGSHLSSGSHQFGAFNATTGNLIWNYTVNGSVLSSPAISNGRVYFWSRDNLTYALNATSGSLIWTYRTRIIGKIGAGDAFDSSPIVSDNILYIGSHDNKVYALNASTGASIWNYSGATDMIPSSPSLANGILYIGSRDNKVYALNSSSGLEIWNNTVTTTDGIISSPAVAGGIVYIGGKDNRTYALNATNGAQIWNATVGGTDASPAVHNGRVYVGSGNDGLYALNATNGNFLWNFSVANDVVVSLPAITNNGVVFYGTVNNKTYALNASTGVHIWNFTTNGSIYSSPAIANGYVYFTSTDRQIYAFGSNNPPTIAVTSPSTNIVSDSTFTINWTSADSDNTTGLRISCYGDTNQAGNDKVITCFENTTNDGTQSCDTTTWPAGQTFGIFCSSNDGIDITYDYTDGNVTIQHNSSWIQHQSDSMHTGVSTTTINNATLGQLWNFSIGGAAQSSADGPVVKNNMVIIEHML